MTAVKAENIAVQNTTTVSRALEGAAPGIRVSSVDGQPGYDMAVRIRGVSSTNGASAAALIVIDGVAQQTNSTYENPLSQLDPNDRTPPLPPSTVRVVPTAWCSSPPRRVRAARPKSPLRADGAGTLSETTMSTL